MMSDTPRTDNPDTGYRSHYAEHEHNRELCRQLERELAQAEAEIAERDAEIANTIERGLSYLFWGDVNHAHDAHELFVAVSDNGEGIPIKEAVNIIKKAMLDAAREGR